MNPRAAIQLLLLAGANLLLPALAQLPIKLELWEHNGWNGYSKKIYIAKGEEGSRGDIIFITRDFEDKVDSFTANIPVGTYVSLLIHNVAPEFKEYHQSYDIVGTGRIQRIDIDKMKGHGMNDQVSAYYWDTYDEDIGYVNMWEHGDYLGVEKILFLSKFEENIVIDIFDWYMNDKVDSMKWEHLGKDIEVIFYEHRGTGREMKIYWTGNVNTMKKRLLYNDQMNDQISAFKWRRKETPKPVVAPTVPPSEEPTLKPISAAETCETDTELLMTQIHSEYNDKDVTETILSTSQVFVDFSTNSDYNTLYAAACAGKGNYQELHYTATCTKTGGGSQEKIIVSGHPRCYALTCEQEDQAKLLQNFAIQLMEERANENSGKAITCEGEKSMVKYSGLCDYQTQTLNSAADLKLAQLKFKPSVEAKKFLWIFDRTDQLVTFAGGAGASNYQIACTASDGILSVKTIQALCTDEATDEVADVPYSIQGYTVCLASGCNSDATDTAALGSFVSMMKIQTEFSTTMACEVSGAGLLPMGVVMALMFCSVLWQAC